MKMTLDQLIARLQDLREKNGGDTLVAIPGAGSHNVDYVDAAGFVRVGKSNPNHNVSRGGVPIVVIYGQNS